MATIIYFTMREEIKESVLTVEQQKKITMSGVASVDSFSENVILLTVNGKKVRIEGSKLKVLAFSEGSGNFTASGEVSLIKYGVKSRISRLFQ